MIVNSYASTGRDSQWIAPGTREPAKIVRAREIRYISREGEEGNPDGRSRVCDNRIVIARWIVAPAA
jgi:hypothetical protein